jgi:polyisoprenyl-teichoic acid--peptidoglycan teichoic acid transferase
MRTLPQHDPDQPRVSNQAPYARNDDTLPYDREMIRSGGTSAPRDRRSRAARRAPAPRRARSSGGLRSFLRVVRNLLLVVVLASIVGIVLLGMRAASFNTTVSSASFPSSALFLPLRGSEPVNVLVVGYGGGDHAGAYLADSIQIMSIDPATGTTTTIPIPRDLWIEGVASLPQNGKVNEAFAAGVGADGAAGIDNGAALLAEVVSDVTGLRIDHWLAIDFEGFSEMIDAVGGVTVDNPVAFSYATRAADHNAGRWNVGSFAAGPIHLDGAQALAYSRARYTSVVAESTDFARSVRQARILAALRSEVGDGGVGAIPAGLGLMDAMEGRMRTDLSAIDLALLSSHLSSDRRIELSEGVVLTATSNTIGQYILIPIDWTGPGAYDGMRAFIATELARLAEVAPTDAP